MGLLNDGILGEARAPGPAYNEPKVPLILAGNRTKRPNILRKFKIYQGGWDISNKHYWAVRELFFSIMFYWVGLLLLVCTDVAEYSKFDFFLVVYVLVYRFIICGIFS